MRKAFTLIEVNLAMLVMATGILSVVGLYAFGYRESRESREDVAAAAFADAVISPLVMAITATNLDWETFKDLESFPSDRGWADYLDSNSGVVEKDPETTAEGVFSSVMTQLKASGNGVATAFPTAAKDGAGMSCGLVVLHRENSPIVQIGFRATKLPGTLLAMPLFYTEARFQGKVEYKP